jgi:hypothetical protein
MGLLPNSGDASVNGVVCVNINRQGTTCQNANP